MKVLILNAKHYDFMNDDGEKIKGCSVYYLVEEAADILKLTISEFNKNLHLLDELTDFPAIYQAEFSTSVSRGRMISTITDLVFDHSVDLFAV